MARKKHPWIAFFVGDWKKDPAVSFCSPETRGVWFDFLCDMHELQSGGVLTGDADQLCRSGRCSRAQLDRSLVELRSTRAAEVSERNGVYTVINRRMKAEADLSKTRAEAGSSGGSSTQAKKKQITDSDIEDEVKKSGEEFGQVWQMWLDHREQIRKPCTLLAKHQQIQQLKAMGEARAIAAIRHSIANGWQGIFEPKAEAGASGKTPSPGSVALRKPNEQWKKDLGYDRPDTKPQSST